MEKKDCKIKEIFEIVQRIEANIIRIREELNEYYEVLDKIGDTLLEIKKRREESERL
ncbi:hypothetical protein J7J62_03900 [bacterium]|nr:hypothetical protein [bacterium]